jgi:hypothetical protein
VADVLHAQELTYRLQWELRRHLQHRMHLEGNDLAGRGVTGDDLPTFDDAVKGGASYSFQKTNLDVRLLKFTPACADTVQETAVFRTL